MRLPLRSGLVWLAACSVLVLALAACQGAAEPDDTGAADPTEEPDDSAEATDDGGEATEGGEDEVVVVLPANEPGGLDPAIGGTGYGEYQNLYEPLVDSYAKDNEIHPLAAESWEVSDDGLTYTFQLREDLYWSDGEPLTAHDFRYAWIRQIDPEVGAYAPDRFYEIANARAFNQGEIDDPDEVGIEVPDDHTLVVTLEAPAAYWLRMAGTQTYFPIREDVLEEHGDEWMEPGNFVGNGPYMLEEWVHDQRLEFVKNPHYNGPWKDTRHVDRIVYRVFEDAWSDAVPAFEAGEVDTALIPPAELERLSGQPDYADQIAQLPLAGGSILVFDTANAPTDDVRVRQAMTMAVDWQALSENVLRDSYREVQSFSPPELASHDPDSFLGHDPDAARDLLAEAGYPDGEGFPELQLTSWTVERERLIAQALAAMWQEELGISVSIEALESAAMTEWRNTRAEEPFNVYLALQWAAVEDPRFYHVAMLDPESNVRHSRYADEEYVELMRTALRTEHGEEYEAQWQEAEAMINRDVPIVTTVYEARNYVVAPRLENFVEVTTRASDMTRVAQPPGLQVVDP